MIPRILKGSTSAEVSVAITGGIPASALLELEYQGVKRTFAPGDTVAVIFTAEETANFRLGTFPVRLRLIHENGNVAELSNPGGKITVTDCPALASGGTVAVSVRSILEGVNGLGERFRDSDVKTLLNTIVARLGGTVAAFALCLVLPVFGASISVTTAPKGALYNDEEVVTGVALDTSGLATSNDLAQESEARYALETNLLAQIAAATPADYNTVKGQVSTNADDIATLKTGKQDSIADLSDIRAGAALGATALQSYTESDPSVPSWAKAADKPEYGWSEITNKPAFATVATSGAYSDLSGKPTIPTVPTKLSAFTNDVGYLRKGDTIKLGSHDDVILEMSGLTIQDEDEGYLEGVFFDYEELEWWDGSASGRIHYADIANRSDIPTVPTNVSAFTNDAGYLTQHQSLSGYATKTWVGNQGYLTSYTETDPNAAGIASNVVTTAYIREKLGVYLYIGEDNGIYVHIP